MDEDYKGIIKAGFAALKLAKGYTQSSVVRKIKALGFPTAEATFSNILNNGHIGLAALRANSEGIRKLIAQECCLQWDGLSSVFINIPDCTPQEVQQWSEEVAYQQKDFRFHHKGRLTTQEKTCFFSTAKKEMVVFGVTLNTFTSYFFSRNQEEFKMPIHALLARGVNIKCYLLDPRCNEARLYFNDRTKFYIEEREGLGKIRSAIFNFKNILAEASQQNFPGKIELYTYRHIPHQYMMAIDPNTAEGKMHVSHYLYGELRANCPVIECTRAGNASLFLRYRNSLEKLTQGAMKVTDFDQFLQ